MLAETIGAVLAATDACSPGGAATTAQIRHVGAGGAGEHEHIGSTSSTQKGWCDKDGVSQSSLSSLKAIGAAAGLKLNISEDGQW